MIRLTPGSLTDLIAVSDEHDDPFGLLAIGDGMGAGIGTPNEAEYLEDAEQALSDIIEGHDDRFRTVIAKHLDRPERLLDRITAELAAAAGCDPATACAIARILDGDANIQNSADDKIVLYVDEAHPSSSEHCLTRVWVSEDVLWDAVGRLLVTMPETTLSAAIGRKLRDVVSHPVLDRHDLTVTGADNIGLTRFLLVDSDRTPLNREELLAMRPTVATFGAIGDE